VGPAGHADAGRHDANDASLDADGWTRRVFGVCPFTPTFNCTGTPAISLPLGWASDGLPIGVQLSVPMCEEAALIRVGAQLEEAMP
jgi:amidase